MELLACTYRLDSVNALLRLWTSDLCLSSSFVVQRGKDFLFRMQKNRNFSNMILYRKLEWIIRLELMNGGEVVNSPGLHVIYSPDFPSPVYHPSPGPSVQKVHGCK